MSSKYKFVDPTAVYFVTSTIVDWIDVFTRDIYRNIFIGKLSLLSATPGVGYLCMGSDA